MVSGGFNWSYWCLGRLPRPLSCWPERLTVLTTFVLLTAEAERKGIFTVFIVNSIFWRNVFVIENI